MGLSILMFYPSSLSLPLAHKLLQDCMDKIGNCCHKLQASYISQEISTKAHKMNIPV